jgi:hypothetical protein
MDRQASYSDSAPPARPSTRTSNAMLPRMPAPSAIPAATSTFGPTPLPLPTRLLNDTYSVIAMTSEVINQVQRISGLSSSMQARMAPTFQEIQEASSHESNAGSTFTPGPISTPTPTTAAPGPAGNAKRQIRPKMRPPPEPEQVDGDDEGHLSASESNRPVPLERVEDGGGKKAKAKGKGKQVSKLNV